MKKRLKNSFEVYQMEQENKEFERSKYKADKFGNVIKEVCEED